MIKVQHPPETNSFGLVLPPSPEELDYLSYNKPKNTPDSVERHHLYWPRVNYASSSLAQRFREHRFNSIWILHSDHTNYHSRFDGVPIPAKDVIKAYLEEAIMLDELDLCVTAIEMVNAAIYEGKVSRHGHAENTKKRKIEHIEQVYDRLQLEVITNEVAQFTIERALDLATAA